MKLVWHLSLNSFKIVEMLETSFLTRRMFSHTKPRIPDKCCRILVKIEERGEDERIDENFWSFDDRVCRI